MTLTEEFEDCERIVFQGQERSVHEIRLLTHEQIRYAMVSMFARGVKAAMQSTSDRELVGELILLAHKYGPPGVVT